MQSCTKYVGAQPNFKFQPHECFWSELQVQSCNFVQHHTSVLVVEPNLHSELETLYATPTAIFPSLLNRLEEFLNCFAK